jgi:hypothetical protein
VEQGCENLASGEQARRRAAALSRDADEGGACLALSDLIPAQSRGEASPFQANRVISIFFEMLLDKTLPGTIF